MNRLMAEAIVKGAAKNDSPLGVAATIILDAARRLSKRNEELEYSHRIYNKLLEHELICNACGGTGSVGSPPDDYYDCPECVSRYNKIKADAIRETGDSICNFRGNLENTATKEEIYEHADKVERGEL